MQYNQNAWEKLGDSFTNNYELGAIDYRQNIINTIIEYQNKWGLLDIACADGWFIEQLRKSGYTKDYMGIDITPNLIKRAKKRMPKESFFIGDAMDLRDKQIGLGNKTFGFVLCAGILMHIPDFKKAISEACRVSNKYVMFSTYGTYMESYSLHDEENNFLNYFYTMDDIEMSVPSDFGLICFKSFIRQAGGHIFQFLYERK